MQRKLFLEFNKIGRECHGLGLGGETCDCIQGNPVPLALVDFVPDDITKELGSKKRGCVKEFDCLSYQILWICVWVAIQDASRMGFHDGRKWSRIRSTGTGEGFFPPMCARGEYETQAPKWPQCHAEIWKVSHSLQLGTLQACSQMASKLFALGLFATLAVGPRD